MDDIDITREDGAAGGRYVARVDGVQAELVFRRPEPGLLVATHTETPVPLRGRGIASALVRRLVADARSEGFRIRPVCPFVAAQFDAHPDWSDLRAS